MLSEEFIMIYCKMSLKKENTASVYEQLQMKHMENQ
jgi:hypothetical protein